MAADVELKGRIVKIGGFTGDSLFEDEDGLQAWLPKDQIAVVHQADGTVKVTLPEWLAKKKGFF